MAVLPSPCLQEAPWHQAELHEPEGKGKAGTSASWMVKINKVALLQHS